MVKGVHYTRQATHCVVGVSDFLMTSLARLTVKVGKGVKEAVEDSEVGMVIGGGISLLCITCFKTVLLYL